MKWQTSKLRDTCVYIKGTNIKQQLILKGNPNFTSNLFRQLLKIPRKNTLLYPDKWESLAWCVWRLWGCPNLKGDVCILSDAQERPACKQREGCHAEQIKRGSAVTTSCLHNNSCSSCLADSKPLWPDAPVNRVSRRAASSSVRASPCKHSWLTCLHYHYSFFYFHLSPF